MAKKTSKVAKKTVVKTVEPKVETVKQEVIQPEIISKREAARQRTFRKLRKFGKYIQVEPIIVRDVSTPVRCEVCQRILVPCKDHVGSLQFPDNEKYIAYTTICRKCLRDAQIVSVTLDDLHKLAMEEFPKTDKEWKLVKKVQGEMMPCDACGNEVGSDSFIYWNNNHMIPIQIHYCTKCYEGLYLQNCAPKCVAVAPTLKDVKESAEDLLQELKEV